MSSGITVTLDFYIVKEGMIYASQCTAVIRDNGHEECVSGVSSNMSFDIAKAESRCLAIKAVTGSSIFLSSLINRSRTSINTLIGEEVLVINSQHNKLESGRNTEKFRSRNERFGIIDQRDRLAVRKSRFGVVSQNTTRRDELETHRDKLLTKRDRLEPRKYKPQRHESKFVSHLDVPLPNTGGSCGRRKLSPEEKKQLDIELDEYMAERTTRRT
jgi:hypothetical protein